MAEQPNENVPSKEDALAAANFLKQHGVEVAGRANYKIELYLPPSTSTDEQPAGGLVLEGNDLDVFMAAANFPALGRFNATTGEAMQPGPNIDGLKPPENLITAAQFAELMARLQMAKLKDLQAYTREQNGAAEQGTTKEVRAA